jgi:hypothetical protein
MATLSGCVDCGNGLAALFYTAQTKFYQSPNHAEDSNPTDQWIIGIHKSYCQQLVGGFCTSVSPYLIFREILASGSGFGNYSLGIGSFFNRYILF